MGVGKKGELEKSSKLKKRGIGINRGRGWDILENLIAGGRTLIRHSRAIAPSLLPLLRI